MGTIFFILCISMVNNTTIAAAEPMGTINFLESPLKRDCQLGHAKQFLMMRERREDQPTCLARLIYELRQKEQKKKQEERCETKIISKISSPLKKDGKYDDESYQYMRQVTEYALQKFSERNETSVYILTSLLDVLAKIKLQSIFIKTAVVDEKTHIAFFSKYEKDAQILLGNYEMERAIKGSEEPIPQPVPTLQEMPPMAVRPLVRRLSDLSIEQRPSFADSDSQ